MISVTTKRDVLQIPGKANTFLKVIIIMNKHSIKVTRLYKVSALVAKETSEGLGSIKSLVYEKKKKHPNIKAIYALVTTLYQKLEVIETLLKRSQLLVNEPKFDPWLAKVLMVELLWGKKKIPGQSTPESTIRAYEQIFKAHLSDDISQETTKGNDSHKPRYVRVNTLLLSLNEAIEGFRDEGWILNKFLDHKDYKGYLEKVISLHKDEFMVDIHVPNLLVFPEKTTFYNHPAYKNGSILLQDKASCLPVHILSPPPNSKVLDMCAAPGMKTTHLAALLNDQGIVYATERNPKRFEILSRIVETSGAKCIKTLNRDVLECSKNDFPEVEYILVDPSCSGTGMTDRPQENEVTQSRLNSLTGFQIKILRHALTRFPDAKKVVYSTCSILPEENEDVVRQVLETNYNFKLVPAQQYVGDTWQNFGSTDFGDIGKYCLYAKPNEDYTNGFFVAVFERVPEGEENPFFNTRIFNFKKHVQANEKWKEKKQRQFDTQNQQENENDIVGRQDNLSEKKGRKKTKEDDQNKKELKTDENNEIKPEESMDTVEKRKSKKNKRKEDKFIDEEIINNENNLETSSEHLKNKKLKTEKPMDIKEDTKRNKKIKDSTINEDEIIENDFEGKTDKKKKRKKPEINLEMKEQLSGNTKIKKPQDSEDELVKIKNVQNEFGTKIDKKKKSKYQLETEDSVTLKTEEEFEQIKNNVDDTGKKKKKKKVKEQKLDKIKNFEEEGISLKNKKKKQKLEL